jgi:hypothetical protein
VKSMDGVCEGGEVGDFGIGEKSVVTSQHMRGWTEGWVKYSASNWFGSIRSASRSNCLYCGTSSAGIYSLPSSPITGSRTIFGQWCSNM